jgi:hypothetical protein
MLRVPRFPSRFRSGTAILRKLGVSSRGQAVSEAARLGLHRTLTMIR